LRDPQLTFASSHSTRVEVRILDDAEPIAEWVPHGSNLDSSRRSSCGLSHTTREILFFNDYAARRKGLGTRLATNYTLRIA
jgi:hypothetical protein